MLPRERPKSAIWGAPGSVLDSKELNGMRASVALPAIVTAAAGKTGAVMTGAVMSGAVMTWAAAAWVAATGLGDCGTGCPMADGAGAHPAPSATVTAIGAMTRRNALMGTDHDIRM